MRDMVGAFSTRLVGTNEALRFRSKVLCVGVKEHRIYLYVSTYKRIYLFVKPAHKINIRTYLVK